MGAKEILNELDKICESIKPESLDWVNDVQDVFNIFFYAEKLKDFRKTLECAIEELKKKEKQTNDEKEKKKIGNSIKSLYSLLFQLYRKEPDYLLENLKKEGYKISSSEEPSMKKLYNSIKGHLLRILEQTRLGKKEVVIHILMRDFTVSRVRFPQELIEVMKDQYDISKFQAFIYAFLSAFVEEKE